MAEQPRTSAEVVSIGCRLPNGIVLEVGLQTTVKGGPHGRPVEQIRRLQSYKRIRLGGTHDHTRAMRKAGIQTPAMLAAEPFITRGIPKALWEEWKRSHPDSWFLASNNIFEVKDEKDIRAQILDSMATPTPLGPIDPTKPMIVGSDKSTIETADFTKE